MGHRPSNNHRGHLLFRSLLTGCIFADLFTSELELRQSMYRDLKIIQGKRSKLMTFTRNPSFKVQSALLSRCRVFTLNKLTSKDIESILRRAVEGEVSKDEEGRPRIPPQLDDDMLSYLALFADGDARTALNLLELAMSLSTKDVNIKKDDIKKSLTRTLVYDRSGDMHYDTISAFHKSVRGSNADAALYYLGRMLKGGEVCSCNASIH